MSEIKSERLKKSSQFKNVYKKGKSKATKYLVIYYLKNDEGINRVGYSASKKVGNSVVRNRARRLMKEAFRLNCGKAKVGYDIVFIARVRITEADYKDVEKSMTYLLRRLGE